MLSMSIGKSPDGKYYEFRFDDKGEGYPEEILRLGFKEARLQGIHGYQDKQAKSEGTGMAAYKKKIEQLYGGELIPSKRIDKDGTVLPGARTILRLPVEK